MEVLGGEAWEPFARNNQIAPSAPGLGLWDRSGRSSTRRWPMRSNSPLDLAVARGHCCPNKCLWFRIPRNRCSGRRADRSAVQSVSIHAPHAGRHQVGQTVTLTQSKSRPPISHTPNCSSMWTASKQHTTPCSIPNRHTIPFGASIPNCYLRHRRRPTASTVCKKPDLPLRCHAVAMALATPHADA